LKLLFRQVVDYSRHWSQTYFFGGTYGKENVHEEGVFGFLCRLGEKEHKKLKKKKKPGFQTRISNKSCKKVHGFQFGEKVLENKKFVQNVVSLNVILKTCRYFKLPRKLIFKIAQLCLTCSFCLLK